VWCMGMGFDGLRVWDGFDALLFLVHGRSEIWCGGCVMNIKNLSRIHKEYLILFPHLYN
jgi:hypothetical protein